jgi:hypothetical protein
MAAQLDVYSEAAILLGVSPPATVTDLSTQVIAFNAVWNTERQAELRKNTWKFSVLRVSLAAVSAGAPASGPFNTWFQISANLPNYLRILLVGDVWPASDLSDFRSGESSYDWSVENGYILTNLAVPLSVKYVSDIVATQPAALAWDAAFVPVMAARLAGVCCYRITNSTALVGACSTAYKMALMDAVKANAIESVPAFTADDTWVQARFS